MQHSRERLSQVVDEFKMDMMKKFNLPVDVLIDGIWLCKTDLDVLKDIIVINAGGADPFATSSRRSDLVKLRQVFSTIAREMNYGAKYLERKYGIDHSTQVHG